MAFIELVCITCQESRYKSKIEITPEMKLAPEMFIPIGEQPDASTYKDGPVCYKCNDKLHPMPVGERKKLPREEAAALRESQAERKLYEKPMNESESAPLIATIFECGPDESNMEMSTLPDGRVLVKTSRRLFILNLKEALGV